MRRHRKLHENSVYGRIAVQRIHTSQQLRFGRRLRQTEFEGMKAAFARVVALAAHVHIACRIISHQHHSQAGDNSVRGFQFRALIGNARAQTRRRRLAIDDPRAHCSPPIAFSRAESFALSP